MAFSAVGSPIDANSTTFSVSPVSVSNFILVIVLDTFGTANPTGITGGNCTWTQLGSGFSGNVYMNWAGAIFVGTPQATGSATATVVWNGTPANTRGDGMEFSSTHGWALDTQGFIDSTGTNTWAGELYFGYCWDSGSASAGSTPGFNYFPDSRGNGVGYNVNCTAAAQAPVWGDAGFTSGMMILIKDAAPLGLLLGGL
jgi:hypothetical protein